VTDNFVILLVGDEGVDALPPGRKVRAGVEDLRLGIEWRAGGWTEVTLDHFVRVDGSPVAIEEPARFVRGGQEAGVVRFTSMESRTDFCEYDVTVKGPEHEPRRNSFPLLLVGVRDEAPTDGRSET